LVVYYYIRSAVLVFAADGRSFAKHTQNNTILVLTFVAGVLAGLGATLVVVGLVEREKLTLSQLFATSYLIFLGRHYFILRGKGSL